MDGVDVCKHAHGIQSGRETLLTSLIWHNISVVLQLAVICLALGRFKKASPEDEGPEDKT